MTDQSQDQSAEAQPARIDQREEAAKAIRFMLVKAAIFILIPIIASALAIFFLL
ncbi:phosphoribosylformylglycinamidine synthase-associated small membrane protein [uncultured Cohaesibacter sp.]|uniref:phosphoribosylformylglycinamidine synthase-associated small membrane protein n=1 Tax=uncultured Cohaesibacter sp. TaxID=1002546 RepID=UPI0029C67A25|nr:phosphoribosylformylglycinamidine synthase-associated small membrane protein [uncultured Cohaesibacter sp.]